MYRADICFHLRSFSSTPRYGYGELKNAVWRSHGKGYFYFIIKLLYRLAAHGLALSTIDHLPHHHLPHPRTVPKHLTRASYSSIFFLATTVEKRALAPKFYFLSISNSSRPLRHAKLNSKTSSQTLAYLETPLSDLLEMEGQDRKIRDMFSFSWNFRRGASWTSRGRVSPPKELGSGSDDTGTAIR